MKSRDGKVKWYRSRSNTFKVRFYAEDGLPRDRSCKTQTERDALIRAIKRLEELDYWFPPEERHVANHEVGSFRGLAEKWMEHAEKVREISESCLGNYRSHLENHIYPEIGASLLKDMDLKSIEKVAAILKGKRPQTRSYVAVRKNRTDEEFFQADEFLSAAYRREILTVACMITKFGLERGYLVVNPFREYKLPECPEQPYDYWRLEEEDAFLQWLEDGGYVVKQVCKPYSKKLGKPENFTKRFRTRNVDDLLEVVLFALRSGLRKGEIGALTSRDVNFERNCIVVRRAYSEKEKRVKDTTKGKTFRIIELNDDMTNILKKRIGLTKSDMDLLFNTRTWAIKNFSKYCVKAGVREIHFHSLRHTCLTNLANGYGMDAPLPLPQVQKIAGHRDIGTTMRYVHTDGIENTTSRQWSRERRKVSKLNPSMPVPVESANAVEVSAPAKLPGGAIVAAMPVSVEVPTPMPTAASGFRFRVIAGGRS
jgi:integrase